MGIAIPMLDLMFFLTENQDNPRHVGAVLIFERPTRGGATIVRRVVSAYRRARPVPPFNRVPVLLRAGLPEWREVRDFDMHWHVQQVTLPPPGTDAQLHELVAQLHAPMLERDRPGWQVFVIDGLERNRFALFIKVHHALVDGESGIELVHRSLSHSARDRRIRTVVETTLPAPAQHERGELLPRLEHELDKAARTVVSVGLGSQRLLAEGLAGLRGFSPEETRPFTAPLTPMNEPIRNARAIAHTVLPLPAMKAVARRWDATLNDVALCVLDAGMNRYLRGLGRAPERPLVAICPVSLQQAERQAGDDPGVRFLDAAWDAGRRGRPTHARADREHPCGQGAHPLAAAGRGLRLRGADLRAGRGDGAAAARRAGFLPAVQRADLERARAGRGPVPRRGAPRGALPGVHADRRHGAEHHVHVLRRAGGDRVHLQRVGAAPRGPARALHARGVRRARAAASTGARR